MNDPRSAANLHVHRHSLANSTRTMRDVSSQSEIRKHYFLERYVVIAPKRSLRPDSFSKTTQPDRPVATQPAFEADKSIFELKNSHGDWQVRVIKNLYSALSLDNPRAYGSQEIVVDTPDYQSRFSDLPVAQIERIFEAYMSRTKALQALEGIRYVVVFKNSGPNAGASIAHSHSQIVAIPFIPPTVELEAAAYDEYVRAHGSSPFQDIIQWELGEKQRIIFEDEHAIALSPYAVREAFGVWILPKQQRARFADLTDSERHSFAVMLKKLTGKLDSVNIDYNYFLQDSLAGEHQHFHLKLEPRPNIWAGFELSTGVIINPISPEYASLWYQDKL